MKTLFGILAVAVIVSASIAWTFRFHVVVGNEPLTVYSIDRWTGEVSLIAPEPTVRTIASQPLEFARTPLVSLRGSPFRDERSQQSRSDGDADSQQDR